MRYPTHSIRPAAVVAMKHHNAMSNANPTILRMPTWYSKTAFEEMALDLAPEDYLIVSVGDRVSISERVSGQLVYAGIGPVEITVSPAPF